MTKEQNAVDKDKVLHIADVIPSFKIGVTKDPKTRLYYFKKQYPNFKFIKVFETKHPYLIESMIIEQHYKDDFGCYGSEWYGNLSDSMSERLCKEVEETINDYKCGNTTVSGFSGLKNKLKKGFVYVGVSN